MFTYWCGLTVEQLRKMIILFIIVNSSNGLVIDRYFVHILLAQNKTENIC